MRRKGGRAQSKRVEAGQQVLRSDGFFPPDGGQAGTYRLEKPAFEDLVRGELDAAGAQEVEADVVTGVGG